MKKTLFVLLLAPMAAFASGAEVRLDKAPADPNDMQSLQRGSGTFVNYCLTCHSASYMRYNRLQELGFKEGEIKSNLMFAGEKIGETMTVAMDRRDATQWFGAPPPDLTVIARSRGANWLYTYLRSFYRDEGRPTGWNNLVFDKVAMPHVLYQFQGEQVLKEEGGAHGAKKLVLQKPGSLNAQQYDAMVADLVNYLAYMGEPIKATRIKLGIFVLAFLAIFFVVVYNLKKEYWKDVH